MLTHSDPAVERSQDLFVENTFMSPLLVQDHQAGSDLRQDVCAMNLPEKLVRWVCLRGIVVGPCKRRTEQLRRKLSRLRTRTGYPARVLLPDPIRCTVAF